MYIRISNKNTLAIKSSSQELIKKACEVKSKWAANACVVLASYYTDRNKIFIITIQAAKHQSVNVLWSELLFIFITSNTTQALTAHFDFISFLSRLY